MKRQKKYPSSVNVPIDSGTASFLAMQPDRCEFVREAIREKMEISKHEEYIALKKEMGFQNDNN